MSGGETSFFIDGTVHTFRSSGTLSVTEAGEVEVLLIGGGGGSGGEAWNVMSSGRGGSGIVIIRYRTGPDGTQILLR